MNAMENASKNSKEMLEVIKLNYNKARQAKITNELCEIISGANALWSCLYDINNSLISYSIIIAINNCYLKSD